LRTADLRSPATSEIRTVQLGPARYGNPHNYAVYSTPEPCRTYPYGPALVYNCCTRRCTRRALTTSPEAVEAAIVRADELNSRGATTVSRTLATTKLASLQILRRPSFHHAASLSSTTRCGRRSSVPRRSQGVSPPRRRWVIQDPGYGVLRIHLLGRS
jgi:hypothetical protein